MPDTSRRRLLGVAGAGVAAVGATTFGVGAASAAPARLRSSSATEPLVAHVADITSDQVSLMVGEHEVLVRDRDLVTRLLNAAGEGR